MTSASSIGARGHRLTLTSGSGRLLLLLMLAPPVARAQPSQFLCATNDGAITIVTYEGPGGAVAIPDRLGNLPIVGIGGMSFAGRADITSITMGDSVTNIGDNAFYWCSGLTTATVGRGVTSIGAWAFGSCFALASVAMGASVASIGEAAFENCYALASVAIPASVTSIGSEAFENCGLTTATIPDGVASIGEEAFAGCTNLAGVTIGRGTTSIGRWAFDGCTNLAGISVDGLNPAYSSAEGVLFDKARATLIAYPEGKIGAAYTVPGGVTSIADKAFEGCEGLVSVVLPDSVTSLGEMTFSNCYRLASIATGNGVISIPTASFYGCGNLTNAGMGSGVAAIGDSAFEFCTNLADVGIPAGVTSIGERAFMGCPLARAAIPSGVTNLSDFAFAECPNLVSVTLPTGIGGLGQTEFGDCSSLASITIPSNIRSIGIWAFNGCDKLTAVYFLGDAPASDPNCFGVPPFVPQATMYYLPGASGWGATLSGRPTALWDPRILAGAGLGAQAGDSASTSPARATWWSWWRLAAASRARSGGRYGPTSSAGARSTSATPNGRATPRASTASAGRDLGQLSPYSRTKTQSGSPELFLPGAVNCRVPAWENGEPAMAVKVLAVGSNQRAVTPVRSLPRATVIVPPWGR